MTTSTSRLLGVIVSVALLGIGTLGGYLWARRSPPPASAPSSPPAPAVSERTVLYWYDPMVPEQRFDKPGQSPFMDMPLVPRYADEAASGVRIDAAQRQSVGIRTEQVGLGQLDIGLRVPGTLGWDLRLESVVSARAEGLVTHVLTKAPFTPVHRGQALATLIAPGWSSAVAEARALAEADSPAARELQSAARQRLRNLGVPGGAGAGGATLVAPHDGVISEVLVREGQTVLPGTPLFRVNGLETLWLEASIPQADAGSLRAGTPVEARVDALPEQRFTGEVEALLPQVDANSRTRRARIVLRNPEGRLVPGMFAEVLLQPSSGPALPLVPVEALIATGRESRVIVQTTEGRFEPVAVRTGRSARGRVQILDGLRGGERVVVSGQFLIDSEASLSGALQRLGAEDAAPSTSTSHAPGEDVTTVDAHAGHAMPAAGDVPAQPQPSPRAMPPEAPARTRASPAARTCPVQYWYDPMMPGQHFDKPGKSPFMDMQLVPKFAIGAATDCTARDVIPATTEKQP
ncbi:efflux RND transporter periplasmic adaptor subunit [Pseudoxanthomonas sp. z9]|uniref:efflux RND transporter periplasmic adaptor subunit n=1 Tax=Pseudoxanthomonas sp. z9 TaxID=2584942 RepID=UPI0011450A68|nr:efflux RND transporter periplasmic adaptor subunit [Pseudoxanthomonas sp. z9]